MPAFPSNLNETDILDFVEGAALAPDVAARIQAALAADAAFAALVQGMRADRAALVSLAPEKAPVGLLESVEALLEAETLASVAGVERAASGPVPVVAPRPETRGILARIGPARSLAAAAALALVAGAAWFTLAPGSTTTNARRPVAINAGFDSDATLHRGGPDPAQMEQMLASAREKAEEAATAAATAGLESAATLDEDTGTAADSVALAEATAQFVGPMPPDQNVDAPAPQQPWGMSLTRAAELAREGRLIIEVRSGETDRTQLRLDSLTRRPAAGLRVARQQDASIAAQTAAYVRQQLALARAQSTAESFGTTTPGAPLAASSATADEQAPAPAAATLLAPADAATPMLPPAAAARVLEQGYEAMVMPDERSIRSLLRALTPGTMQVAQLIEMDEPLALQIRQTRVQQQAATLPSAATTGPAAPAPLSRTAKEQARPEPTWPVAVPIVVREK